ncbi:hypothetical protein [Pseudohongiella acticola]|jgi:hypothetical protein|uniref:hypothetical protein n=1 Tax=Pseudohongiella acticola TaxID=1524254 RepID=UPI0030EE8DFB
MKSISDPPFYFVLSVICVLFDSGRVSESFAAEKSRAAADGINRLWLARLWIDGLWIDDLWIDGLRIDYA